MLRLLELVLHLLLALGGLALGLLLHVLRPQLLLGRLTLLDLVGVGVRVRVRVRVKGEWLG